VVQETAEAEIRPHMSYEIPKSEDPNAFASRSGERRPLRIDEIQLSVRTRNCLLRRGLTTVEEVTALSDDELLSIPNFGSVCLNEVTQKIRSLRDLTNPGTTFPEDKPSGAGTEEIGAFRSPNSEPPMRVDEIQLSVRTRNCLLRRGLTTVEEVTALSDDELLSIPNFGSICLQEVNEKLRGLKHLRGEDQSRLTEEHQVVANVIKQGLNRRFGDRFNDVGKLPDLGIRELGLLPRPTKALLNVGIQTVDQLLDMKECDLARVPNLGELSLRNLIRNLERLVKEISAKSDGESEPETMVSLQLLERFLTFQSSRDLEIWFRRQGYRHGDFPTLEQVAGEAKLTRERVRQIESSIDNAIRRSLATHSELSAELIDPLREEIPSISVVGSWFEFRQSFELLVREKLDSAEQVPDDVCDILMWICGPYALKTASSEGPIPRSLTIVTRVGHDKRTASALADLKSSVHPVRGEFVTSQSLTETLQSSGLFRSDLSESSAVLFAEVVLKFQRYSEFGWSSSNLPVGELLNEALLSVERPCSAEELKELSGSPREIRYIKNALAADDRFVRVGIGQYALQAWGMDSYDGVSDEIAAIVERLGGSAPLTLLIGELKPKGIAKNSVVIHATGPRFTTVDEVVSFRETDARERVAPDIQNRSNWWWAGPHTVIWRVLVDGDVLRGSGKPIGEPEAATLGVWFRESRTFKGQKGQSLTIDFPERAMHPGSSSLRTIAEQLDLHDGDWFLIRFDTAKGRFSAVTAPRGGKGIAEMLASHTGVPLRARESPAFYLANRLGCPSTFPDVMECLRARRLTEIMDALTFSPTLPLWPSNPELGSRIVNKPELFGLEPGAHFEPTGNGVVANPLCNPQTQVLLLPRLAEWKRVIRLQPERGMRTNVRGNIGEITSNYECFFAGFAEEFEAWLLIDANPSDDLFADDLAEIIWASENLFIKALEAKSGVASWERGGLRRVAARSESLGDALDEFSRIRLVSRLKREMNEQLATRRNV